MVDPQQNNPLERKQTGWTRRRFLTWGLGAAAAVGGSGGLYTWLVEPHWVQVVRRDLPIDRLPADLDGATLGHVSDLHVGPVVDADYLRGAMDTLAALRPDMVALTGDFMTCRRDEQVLPAAEMVARLTAPAPPLGVFASLGNHDYARRWRYDDVADAFTRQLARRGIRVLRNEAVDAGGLHVIGMDDLWADRFNPADALAELPPDAASLALSHNPDSADRGVWGDWRGWILAGHTHGGQVDLPIIGTPRVRVRNKRYVAGECDAGGGRRLYINRGLGYLTQGRLFCRPEITLFTLRRA